MDASEHCCCCSKINSFSRILWECQVERSDCHFVHLFKKQTNDKEGKMAMQPEALCCCCSQNYVCSNFLGICKHKFISIVEFQMNILYVSVYMELTHERKTTRILAGLVDTEMHFVCVSLSPVTMSLCLCQLNLAYCLLSLSIIQAAKLNLPIFCRLCDFHAC